MNKTQLSMSKDLGRRKKSLPIRFPNDNQNNTPRGNTQRKNYLRKSTCGCRFPFKYRSKEIDGCIKTSLNHRDVSLCAVNDCCESLELTSKLDINSIMWKQLPQLKGTPLTGKYNRINETNEPYYAHQSGLFYLCSNTRGNWQVSYISHFT